MNASSTYEKQLDKVQNFAGFVAGTNSFLWFDMMMQAFAISRRSIKKTL